jgi:hypothetical protein
MKSKDIIACLKEIDPSGETHVRFADGEELIGFERKEGYYDGAYVYKNEDDKLVITDKGEKIDALFDGIETRIWDCEGDLEKIKNEILIDFHTKKDNKDYRERVVKPEAEKARRSHKTSLAEFTFFVLKKITDGWKVTQPCNIKKGLYNQMSFIKGNKTEKLRQGDCHAVLKSGFFKPVKNNGFYIWECLWLK